MTPDPNSATPSPDEHLLIAFHLGEPCDERAIRARLDHDAAFAALSEEIAQTLRVFSAQPVPPVDTEAAWQRLRGTLPTLDTTPPARRAFGLPGLGRGWLIPAFGSMLAVVLIVFFTAAVHHMRQGKAQADVAGVIHLRPPRSQAPNGEADHLDRAERWLTVVNHSTAPLDETTRAEGQQLLTENAVYLRDAKDRGDLPDAAVLDHLGRVLTTSNHPAEAGLQLRLDMNTDGLLFQIRILRQNQTATNGDSQ